MPSTPTSWFCFVIADVHLSVSASLHAGAAAADGLPLLKFPNHNASHEEKSNQGHYKTADLSPVRRLIQRHVTLSTETNLPPNGGTQNAFHHQAVLLLPAEKELQEVAAKADFDFDYHRLSSPWSVLIREHKLQQRGSARGTEVTLGESSVGKSFVLTVIPTQVVHRDIHRLTESPQRKGITRLRLSPGNFAR